MRRLVISTGLVWLCATVPAEPSKGFGATPAPAAQAAQTNGTAADGLRALVQWMKQRGGFIHPAVRVTRLEGHGWDLRLAEGKAVPKGTVLIALPPSSQLSYQRFQASIGGSVESQVPAELWDMRLALALLAAAEDSKSWGPYVQMLPRSLPGLPIFWKGSTLNEAKEAHPTLAKEVMGRVGVMRSVAQGLKVETADGHGGCQHWAGLSLRTLAWAYGIVTSRSVRLDGAETAAGVLLPLIDLANHDFSPTAEIRRQEKASGAVAAGSACLVAARPLQGGERLTLCYGKYSNTRLRLDYGFEIEGNSYEHPVVDARRMT